MADKDRHSTAALALLQELQAEAYRYEFYAAVRRLDCAFPNKPRTGESLRPVDDPVRFSQEPSLAFPPTTVAAFEHGAQGRPPRLQVRFLGLLGPNGPLPLHLTEHARDRLRNHHDPTFARFLDVFHHRMLALFYRGWASAQPTVSLDRPASDRFGAYVGSLCGLGMSTLRERDAMPDLAKLFFTGHLACQSRHPEGLRAMLETFFGLPVAIREFIGEWLRLPADSQCRLGETPVTGSLGLSAIVGERVWETQHKFRVVFSRLTLAQYEGLLPGGNSFSRLVAFVRNYVGDELNWNVNLVLLKEEVPLLRLGQLGRLGWTTWLAGEPFTEDADDLLLEPARYAD